LRRSWRRSRTHRLVAISKSHGAQEIGDQLLTLLSDPRLYGVVNDIVVEFGNAYYQDTIDTFVLDGQPVKDTDLRPVWRNTTQSPNVPIDSPVNEEIYAGSGRSTGLCHPAGGSGFWPVTRRMRAVGGMGP
jgi:hypothetical protein